MASTQQQTAEAIIAGYNAWDIDAILAPRSDDCTHQVLPTTLNRPRLDNERYKEYFASTKPIFKDFTVTVERSMHDLVTRQSCIHCSSTASTPIGPYTNEYMIVLRFNESGNKVTEVLEFVDSSVAAAGGFFDRLRQHLSGEATTSAPTS